MMLEWALNVLCAMLGFPRPTYGRKPTPKPRATGYRAYRRYRFLTHNRGSPHHPE